MTFDLHPETESQTENSSLEHSGSALYVALKDLSGAGNEAEEVRGFQSEKQALSFARAYVCDSVERCRMPGAFGKEALKSWQAFGEDAEVRKGEILLWDSKEDIGQFVKTISSPQERNWRELDPRRDVTLSEAARECFEQHFREEDDDFEL